jgi:nicotinamidase-related amidase
MPAEPKVSLADEHAAGGTALLIVDMISDWQFPDADKLLPAALAVAPPIAALKARCRAVGVPTIYANDNRGLWRSDLRDVVERSLAVDGDGAHITRALKPERDDYFVLKPKHSAFFLTPLELLLQHLKARRLILTGVASDQCIATTAVDGRMRDYEVIAPRDCIGTQTPERDARMLAHFDEALRVPTPASADLELPHAPAQ